MEEASTIHHQIELRTHKIDEDGLVLTTNDIEDEDENTESETMTASPREIDEDPQKVLLDLSNLMKSLKRHFGKVNEILKEVVDDLDNSLK